MNSACSECPRCAELEREIRRLKSRHVEAYEDLPPETLARFWAKVDKSGDCWIWTAKSERFHSTKEIALAPRRLTYRLAFGEVPDEQLRMVCRNVRCVRPGYPGTKLAWKRRESGWTPYAGEHIKVGLGPRCPAGDACENKAFLEEYEKVDKLHAAEVRKNDQAAMRNALDWLGAAKDHVLELDNHGDARTAIVEAENALLARLAGHCASAATTRENEHGEERASGDSSAESSAGEALRGGGPVGSGERGGRAVRGGRSSAGEHAHREVPGGPSQSDSDQGAVTDSSRTDPKKGGAQ